MKSEKISFKIDKDSKNELIEMAKIEDLNISIIVRQIVRQHLTQVKARIPKVGTTLADNTTSRSDV